MVRRWGVISLMVVLGGCARTDAPPGPPPQYDPAAPTGGQYAQRPDPQSDATVQNDVDLGAIRQECAASMQTPRLDPIRNKVELIKPTNAPIPFAILSNHNYPTASEREAIAIWGTLDDECQRRVLTREQSRIAAGGADQAIFVHLAGYVAIELQLANELRDVLHEGKLTYSDYAKVRQALYDASARAMTQYVVYARAADDRAMAAVDASYQRTVAAAQAFMERVMHGAAGQAPQVRVGGAPPPDGRGMMEPPPIGAKRPQPPAAADGMLEPPPVGANRPQPPADANGMMAPPTVGSSSQ